MILLIECIAACIIFGTVIVGTTVKNKEMWFQEFSPEVQKRYMELHPDFVPKKSQQGGIGMFAVKLLVCAVFLAILTGLVYIAGARTFLTGAGYSYLIWSVVNIFDATVIDILILTKWKKCRLDGTEDMDKEYAANTAKSLKDGVAGILIGIPVCALTGLIIHIIK